MLGCYHHVKVTADGVPVLSIFRSMVYKPVVNIPFWRQSAQNGAIEFEVNASRLVFVCPPTEIFDIQ